MSRTMRGEAQLGLADHELLHFLKYFQNLGTRRISNISGIIRSGIYKEEANMIVDKGAPKQHNQPSRKGKKAWRKNVDIEEVENGIDEVREEIIRGGVITEKSSSELFTLDTAGSTAIKASYRRKHKPLKTDEILAQRSAVPAVENRKRPASSKVTDGVLPERAPKRPKISRGEIERLRRIARGGSGGGGSDRNGDADSKLLQTEATHDLWTDTAARGEREKEPTLSFLETKLPKRAPATIKQSPVSQLASGLQAPAVRKPEAGRSYNPTFEDWDALISKAGAAEIEAERRRQEAAEAEAELQERVHRSAAEADAAERRESQRGDGGDVTESEWEGIESFDEAELNRKRPERKTKAQRNKIKRRKEAEREAARDAAQKKKEKEIGRIKLLARELDERKRLTNLKANKIQSLDEVHSDSSDAEEVVRQRKLGKAAIPEASLELVLADELQESLRLLKPEGNILRDRFRNMLIQGKIESRRPLGQRRKPRRTLTEKWSYKDWKLK